MGEQKASRPHTYNLRTLQRRSGGREAELGREGRGGDALVGPRGERQLVGGDAF